PAPAMAAPAMAAPAMAAPAKPAKPTSWKTLRRRWGSSCARRSKPWEPGRETEPTTAGNSVHVAGQSKKNQERTIFALSQAPRHILSLPRTFAPVNLPAMNAMSRRSFLRNAAAASAGLALAPRVLGWQATAAAATTSPTGSSYPLLPFIEHYQT